MEKGVRILSFYYLLKHGILESVVACRAHGEKKNILFLMHCLVQFSATVPAFQNCRLCIRELLCLTTAPCSSMKPWTAVLIIAKYL